MKILEDMSAPASSDWAAIIGSIKNPLTFFALALLMVEALIDILSVNGSGIILTLSFLGTGMFVFVVSMVVLLLFKSPEALLAVKVSDLRRKVHRIKSDVRYLKMSQLYQQALQNPDQFMNSPEIPPRKLQSELHQIDRSRNNDNRDRQAFKGN